MAVTIRLSRHGKRNKPFYRVVVACKAKPRDGRFLEVVGIYDPNNKAQKIKTSYANYIKMLENRINEVFLSVILLNKYYKEKSRRIYWNDAKEKIVFGRYYVIKLLTQKN